MEKKKMKKTINIHQFRDAFMDIRPDNFSYEGLGILFNWYDEYEDSTGEEMELDVIAICCEWEESTIDEVINNYIVSTHNGKTSIYNDTVNDALEDCDEEERAEVMEEWLQDNTMVAGVTESGSIVYIGF
jgi:hypothetical protein